MYNVKKERTNWRDSKLSDVHIKRELSFPSTNANLIFLEYDKSLPVSIIDYKDSRYIASNYVEKSMVIYNLCENRNIKLPYYTVIYKIKNNTFVEFMVYAQNKIAMDLLGGVSKKFTEEDFVSFLYIIRERNASEERVLPLQENNNYGSGWEGEVISKRHRQWGWNCPASDIDFILESDNQHPCALIEYKNERSYYNVVSFKGTSNCKVMIELSKTKYEIPFFLIFYNCTITEFNVYSINEAAKMRIGNHKKFNTDEYFEFLKELRGNYNG